MRCDEATQTHLAPLPRPALMFTVKLMNGGCFPAVIRRGNIFTRFPEFFYVESYPDGKPLANGRMTPVDRRRQFYLSVREVIPHHLVR